MADLPEVIGFFACSREDDEVFEGTLSALRNAIQRELSAQLGRSQTTLRLWQDGEGIAPGQLWESEIKTAVEQAIFFIPIITPRAVNSRYCKSEFEAFLAREHALGRNDLIFPLLYIGVPALENEAQWRKDPVLSIIGTRQYVDWRPFRHSDVLTTASARRLGASVTRLSRRYASRGCRRKSVENNRGSTINASRRPGRLGRRSDGPKRHGGWRLKKNERRRSGRRGKSNEQSLDYCTGLP